MSYTNSSLSTFRRCPREYELGYEQQLESVEADSEALQVGQAWHKAFEAKANLVDQFRDGPPTAAYDAIRARAPSPLWAEKLSRMYSAYEWYWRDQPINVVETERTFRVEFAGRTFEGQIDGIVEHPDGRRGILERKTTGFSVGAESNYWDKLRLDVQVGLYALAWSQIYGAGSPPDFILYDVVRKPTIQPKKIAKADRARMLTELKRDGKAIYYGENVDAFEHESESMYGARLTADIGDRPEYYFARRKVHRTEDDYNLLLHDLGSTIDMLEGAQASTFPMPRNPDACNVFGLCKFFGLCSNNIHPIPGPPPDGFRRREHLHPELH